MPIDGQGRSNSQRVSSTVHGLLDSPTPVPAPVIRIRPADPSHAAEAACAHQRAYPADPEILLGLLGSQFQKSVWGRSAAEVAAEEGQVAVEEQTVPGVPSPRSVYGFDY